MELTLARQTGTQVLVTCDGQPSHTFDLLTLVPGEKGPPQPLDDPVAYGKAIYQALFPPETAAWSALNANPDRILFISTDDTIDAIPWEYAYGPDDFVVLECHFVRGLTADQRIEAPALDKGLHIVAVLSNPLSHGLESLNIDGEWIRLKEIIQELKEFAITLERTRPPTLERIGLLVVNQQQRIVHFMGHGGQDEKAGALLCFEKDNGDLDAVTARDFMRQLRDNVFLVTLNACISAAPGETHLSNLAAALVGQKTPYALGMRFSIPDEDALAFSRTFYSYLARGSSVEEAVSRVRLTLSRNRQRQWMIGVPVLYTSLSAPTTGFASITGTPEIKENQPQIEVSALHRAEGAFQGRIDELIQLGDLLTSDHRPRLVTIHGSGGQGKTALAREAVERFAYAWPGGVWATTLENLPGREVFVSDLARFLGIDTQTLDPNEIERQILKHLTLRRTLLVLDNTETLIDAVEMNDTAALHLVEFIKQLMSPSVSLLVTSRVHLGWSGEVSYELGGLSPEEGALLFQQSAPQRANEIELTLAKELSHKLEGHPFGLRLLAGSFNASAISLQALIQEWDEQLVLAENKYIGEEHRHRRLYACIEISLRSLDSSSRSLLSELWILRAPFLTETAVAIFDSGHEETESGPSPIRNHLHTLWLRSLLERKMVIVPDGRLQFYYLLPTTRVYVEHYLEQTYDCQTLTARYGAVYAQLARFVQHELNKSATAVTLAQQARDDFEHGSSCVTGIEQGIFLRDWGWIVYRLGDPRHGLTLLERALEIVQGKDQSLELEILQNMAEVYQVTGKPQEALRLLQMVLPIHREMGDRGSEAASLNNIAEVYRFIGQPMKALSLYQEALPLLREVGNRAGEASTLYNIAGAYLVMGKSQEALRLLQVSLLLMREVGDRAGEASTLNKMAEVLKNMGQPQEALDLLQAALPIRREIGDRAGESWTLIGMATVYQAMGQPTKALNLYQEILPIMREVGNRAGEATALSNMAILYRIMDRPIEALHIYQEALLIRREVGDQTGEAATLNNIAQLLQQMQQYAEALKAFEQSITLGRLVFHPAGEAAGLVGMALLLYQHLKRPEDAISNMEQAIAVLMQTDLPQDAAGRTLERLQFILQAMRTGASF